jgi:hypothetical protein
MDIQLCQQCGARVVRRDDGTCPSCHRPLRNACELRPEAGVPARSLPKVTEPAVLAENPFASPMADVSPYLRVTPGELGEMERVRRCYLRHEAAVQSVGRLYYLGAAAFFCVGLYLLFSATDSPPFGPAVLLIGMGVVSIPLGQGLQQLRPWSRSPVGILAAIGVAGFMTAPISGYILYLLFSPNGTMVFSQHYQEIVRQTPHLRTSKLAISCWLLFLTLSPLLLIWGLCLYYSHV